LQEEIAVAEWLACSGTRQTDVSPDLSDVSQLEPNHIAGLQTFVATTGKL